MIDKKKKPTKKGQKTQNKILEVACSQILKNGYHAASTRDIAKNVGMAPSALYSHYKNKEELFKAVLSKYHPWLVIPSIVENTTGSTIEQIVRNASNDLLASWDEHPEVIRLHLIELIEFRGKHLPELFDLVFNKMSESVENLITKTDQLSEIDVDVLIRALLGLFFAYLMTDRYTGMKFSSIVDTTAFDYFADIYLQGVTTNNLSGKKEKGA